MWFGSPVRTSRREKEACEGCSELEADIKRNVRKWIEAKHWLNVLRQLGYIILYGDAVIMLILKTLKELILNMSGLSLGALCMLVWPVKVGLKHLRLPATRQNRDQPCIVGKASLALSHERV